MAPFTYKNKLSLSIRNIGFLSLCVGTALSLFFASQSFSATPLTIYDNASQYFAIKYPIGWDIKKGPLGKQVLFSGPLTNKRYKPTLHVTRFESSLFVDEIGLELYKEELLGRFQKTLGTLANYTITYEDLIDLNPRHKAMLFYGKFVMHGKTFMQANLVVSTRKFHVLVTYTDAESVFKETELDPFKSMWEAMTSLKVVGKPPKERFSFLVYVGLAIGLFIALSLLVFVTKKDSSKRYQSFADEDMEDIPASELESLAATRSQFKSTIPKELSEEDEDDTWKLSS